jgi:hypothetical protein
VGLPGWQSGPQVVEVEVEVEVEVLVAGVVARPPPPEDPPPPEEPPSPCPPTDPPPLPESVEVTVDGAAEVAELAGVPAPDVVCVAEVFAPDVREWLTVAMVRDPVIGAEPAPQALSDVLSASAPTRAPIDRRPCRTDIMIAASVGCGYCRPSRASRTSVTASGNTTAMTERNCSVC